MFDVVLVGGNNEGPIYTHIRKKKEKTDLVQYKHFSYVHYTQDIFRNFFLSPEPAASGHCRRNKYRGLL
jgi:hypothetical protein